MKVFGKFKCLHCDGLGYGVTLSNVKINCSTCNGTGYSSYLQEYEGDGFTLNIYRVHEKDKHYRRYKWNIEIDTPERVYDRDWAYTSKKDNNEYMPWHQWEFETWGKSLKYTVKKALKKTKQAVDNNVKNNLLNLVNHLLEE